MSSASSQQSSLGDELKSESVKYILLVDSQARSRRGVNSSKVKMKFKSKHEDQRVLKGSLWEHCESISPNPSIASLGSGGSRLSTKNLSLSPHARKLELDSIEYDEVRLSCPESQVKEISENECRLLLAVPDSLERYKLFCENERFITSSYVTVNSPVEVNTRYKSSLSCVVRWKGRIPSRQGMWFGVEIVDADRKGSGDTDGTLNNHKYFQCESNDGLFVNISNIKAIPPVKPERRSRRSPSVTRKKLANGHVVSHCDPTDNRSHNKTKDSETTHTSHVVSNHNDHSDSDASFPVDDLESSVPLVPVTEVQVGDRVVWPSSSGYERATVKWMGELPTDNQEEGEMLVGVEFDNPVGKGTGFYQKKRLFCARKGHASLVPLVGLYRELTESADSSSSITTPPPQFCDDMDAHPLSAEEVLRSLAIDNDLNHDPGAETIQTSQKRRLNVPANTNATSTSNRKSATSRLTNGRLPNPTGSRSDHSAATNSSNESLNSPRSMPVTPRKNRASHSNITARSRNNSSRPSTLLSSELRVPVTNRRPSSAGSTSPRSCDWSHESDCQSSPTHTSPFHLPSPVIYSQPASPSKPTSHKQSNTNVQTPPKLPAKRSKAPQSPSHVCRCLPSSGSIIEGCQVIVDGETGVVKWIGYEYSKPNRYFAGVKMDKPNTSCTYGWYGEERLVETISRDILFIGLEKCRLKNETKAKPMSTDFPVMLNTDDEEENDDTLIHPIEKFSRDKLGLWKGIQGENNSCYIDSCLYAMFCLTSTFDHLLSEEIDPGTANLKQIHCSLRDDIVNPLRRNHLVRATSMQKLRKLLDSLGLVKGMTLDEQDPEEFINLLLSNVFHCPPPLHFSNDVTSHIFHLVGERDARIAFPALQELVEHTCAQQKIKFKSIPRYLIVHMPRFGSEFRLYDKVFPNLKLDLRDVLEGATRSCYVCGKPAERECHECYKVELQWKKSTYCDHCSSTFHKHERRTCHVPLKLKASSRSPKSSPIKQSDTAACTLELFALLCIKTSHYVAFCKAQDQTTSQWIFFNSMADRKDNQCIPETSIVENMEYWLSADGFDCIAKDIDSVPTAIKRLLADTYICFYAQTNRTDNTCYTEVAKAII